MVTRWVCSGTPPTIVVSSTASKGRISPFEPVIFLSNSAAVSGCDTYSTEACVPKGCQPAEDQDELARLHSRQQCQDGIVAGQWMFGPRKNSRFTRLGIVVDYPAESEVATMVKSVVPGRTRSDGFSARDPRKTRLRSSASSQVTSRLRFRMNVARCASKSLVRL